MDAQDVWREVDDQRRRLVELLEELSDREWRQQSLCAGWTVRQVAAHVALQNTSWSALPRAAMAVVRHRGINGAIHADACRHAVLPIEQIIGEIRDRIGVWHPQPTVTYLGTAIDYLVHTQDIAVPLGRAVPMPVPTAVVAADRVWSSGRMFHARRRFSGYRFVATDADWSAGRGALVTGPISGLLLLLTGRPAGLATLSGPGAQALHAARSGARQ